MLRQQTPQLHLPADQEGVSRQHGPYSASSYLVGCIRRQIAGALNMSVQVGYTVIVGPSELHVCLHMKDGKCMQASELFKDTVLTINQP